MREILKSISGDFVVTGNPYATFRVKSFQVRKNHKSLTNRW